MFARRLIRLSTAKWSKSLSTGATKVAAPKSKLALASALFVGATSFLYLTSFQEATECEPNYKAVKEEIAKMIEAYDEKIDDGTSIGPTLVRLAWHASGTYSAKDKTGGSNGSTMRLAPEAAWGANAGLQKARDFLAPVATKYKMSIADVWTLAGAVAIESMGGPSIPWKAGRTDSAVSTTVPDGRLPGADKGCPKQTVSHIRDIFGRMVGERWVCGCILQWTDRLLILFLLRLPVPVSVHLGLQ
jgi:hypothetical protein